MCCHKELFSFCFLSDGDANAVAGGEVWLLPPEIQRLVGAFEKDKPASETLTALYVGPEPDWYRSVKCSMTDSTRTLWMVKEG